MPLFLEESSFPVPTLIVIVVAGAVLVSAIILVSLFFISRHKLKKKPGERHEAFDTSYTQLITDCKQSVERLGNLGKYSDDYQKKYVAKKEQYDKIFNGRAKEVKDSLDSMDALRVQKDWHSLRFSWTMPSCPAHPACRPSARRRRFRDRHNRHCRSRFSCHG